MSLLPVSQREVSAAEPLPFDIFDARGRLLLKAQCMPSERTLEGYMRQGIFTTEAQYSAWRRRLARELNVMLREPEITLGKIAQARVGPPAVPSVGYETYQQRQIRNLDAALSEARMLIRKVEQEPLKQAVNLKHVASRLKSSVAEHGDLAVFHAKYWATNNGSDLAAASLLVAWLALEALDRCNGGPESNVVKVQVVACSLLAAGCSILFGYGAQAFCINPEQRVQTYLHIRQEVMNLTISERGSGSPQDVGVADHAVLAAMEVLLDRRWIRFDREHAQQMVRFSTLFDIDRVLLRKLIKAINDRYPVFLPGQLVKLPSGQTGVIVYEQRNQTGVVVARLLDAQGTPLSEPLLARLSQDEITKISVVENTQIKAYFDLARIAECAARGLQGRI